MIFGSFKNSINIIFILIAGTQPKIINSLTKTDSAITDRICELIIKDLQPISIVEDVGFKELIEFAFPNYIMPCRKKVTELIEHKYKIKKSQLLLELTNAEFVALTTDGWAPKHIHNPFVTYTCNHFNEITGKFKTSVLETLPFGDLAHTGENIEMRLRETCEAWKISG